MRNLKALLASFLAVASLPGCMAVGNALGPPVARYEEPQPLRVYGGVRADVEILNRPSQGFMPAFERKMKVVNVIDLPLSFVMDTVLLPVVVIRGELVAADMRSTRREHVDIGPFQEPADVTLDYREAKWTGAKGAHWAQARMTRHLAPGEKWDEELVGWIRDDFSRLEIARPSGTVSLSRVQRADYGPAQFQKDPQGHRRLWVEAMHIYWWRSNDKLSAAQRQIRFTQSMDILLKDGLDPDEAVAPGDHPLAALLKARNNYGADEAVARFLDLGYPKKNRQAVLDEALKLAPTGDSYYYPAPAYRALVRQGAHMDERVGQVLKHLAYAAKQTSYQRDKDAKAAHEELNWLLAHGALDVLKPSPRPSGAARPDRLPWDLVYGLMQDGHEDSALLLLAKSELFDAQDKQELLACAIRTCSFKAADVLVASGASVKKIPWTLAFETTQGNGPRVSVLHWLKTHGGDMDIAPGKVEDRRFLPNDLPAFWEQSLPGLFCLSAERAALRRLAPTQWDANIDGRNLIWSDYFVYNIQDPADIAFVLGWMSARGADLRQKVEGKTLLGCAAKENNTAMVAWLLAHGFDPNEPDDQGKRPMDHELYPETKALLEKAGGHPTANTTH